MEAPAGHQAEGAQAQRYYPVRKPRLLNMHMYIVPKETTSYHTRVGHFTWRVRVEDKYEHTESHGKRNPGGNNDCAILACPKYSYKSGKLDSAHDKDLAPTALWRYEGRNAKSCRRQYAVAPQGKEQDRCSNEQATVAHVRHCTLPPLLHVLGRRYLGPFVIHEAPPSRHSKDARRRK